MILLKNAYLFINKHGREFGLLNYGYVDFFLQYFPKYICKKQFHNFAVRLSTQSKLRENATGKEEIYVL